LIPPARYGVRPWPLLRDVLVTGLSAHRPHTYYGFTQVDVTDALAALERRRREVRIAVSFHAFVLYCLAHATAAHPEIVSYRYRRRIVTFDDVDIATTIDKRLADGTRIPIGYVLRAAQAKSLARINWELREATRGDLSTDATIRLRRRLMMTPAPLRRLVAWRLTRDPFFLRRLFGTIGCTNLQVPGSARPSFGLPPNIFTATVAVGAIAEQIALDAAGTPMVRRMLCLSTGIDHAVVDGIPVARWGRTVADLLEAGAGLDDAFTAETRSLRAGTAT
jgi:pyruvate/2-oxoglutarate dehydrogenase complex dihydrolipoamide acyltransferase (E2) component